MREALRLAYLEALGVPNWVPRRPLARAAPRLPAELTEGDLVQRARVDTTIVPGPGGAAEADGSAPAQAVASRPAASQAEAVDAVRAAVSAPREQAVPAALPEKRPAALAPEAPALAPFYLQLWLAGPCAVLLQIDEPGLTAGSASHRLLQDILRAAELPAPRLLADFRWPLFRNQVDRSAAAASDGLLAFLQARLEGHASASVGCFGDRAALVASGETEQVERLFGREEALDGLPPTWFAPDLEQLMREPQRKAQLWALIKRVKSRWVEAP